MVLIRRVHLIAVQTKTAHEEDAMLDITEEVWGVIMPQQVLSKNQVRFIRVLGIQGQLLPDLWQEEVVSFIVLVMGGIMDKL